EPDPGDTVIISESAINSNGSIIPKERRRLQSGMLGPIEIAGWTINQALLNPLHRFACASDGTLKAVKLSFGMGLPGFPTYTLRSSVSLWITAPIPITQSRAILMLFAMQLLTPRKQFSPTSQ